MIYGLAGKSCSGKNQVAALLEEKGWVSLDLDVMSHQILSDFSSQAADLFGKKILDETGRVDRKKLGPIVFSDPRKLKTLEDLIYPELDRRLSSLIRDRQQAEKPLILNAAALQKSDFWKKCDRILWVSSPWYIRFWRAWRRDGKSFRNLMKRFQSQRELNPQYFFSKVDTYIIKNDGTRKRLKKQIERLLSILPPE